MTLDSQKNISLLMCEQQHRFCFSVLVSSLAGTQTPADPKGLSFLVPAAAPFFSPGEPLPTLLPLPSIREVRRAPVDSPL